MAIYKWLGISFTCVVLGFSAGVHATQNPPLPDNPIRAQTSWGYDVKRRCPDMRIAEEGTAAVVVFWLPRSTSPSEISIKSSSGSSALDLAAVTCVSKLRFAPATTIGEGNAVDSWQQIALRWADSGGTSKSIVPTPTQTAADATPEDSGGHADSVTVHVCVDVAGRLEQEPTIVHSSGTASVDQAAVKIAASGADYYRPETSSNGAPVSGCAQLTIKFDKK